MEGRWGLNLNVEAERAGMEGLDNEEPAAGGGGGDWLSEEEELEVEGPGVAEAAPVVEFLRAKTRQ